MIAEMTSVKPPLSQNIRRLRTDELLELCEKGLLLERAHALECLGQRAGDDAALVDVVVNEVLKPKNRTARVLGTTTVSDFGVAGLLRAGTDRAREAATRLINEWPEPERSDLLWFLKGESLFTDGEGGS